MGAVLLDCFDYRRHYQPPNDCTVSPPNTLTQNEHLQIESETAIANVHQTSCCFNEDWKKLVK